MDTITDMLSTFFVSNGKRNTKTLTDIIKNKEQKEIKTSSKEEEISSGEEISKEKISKEEISKEEEISSGEEISKEEISKEEEISSGEEEIETSSNSENISKIISGGDVNVSLSSDDIETEIELKKYILKPSEYCKKNILFLNSDKEDNVGVLSEFMSNLGLIKNIDTYDKTVTVISAHENKQLFKKMMLENPYLFFTEFNIKTGLVRNKDVDQKRKIYILDMENESISLDYIKRLCESNSQVFVMCSNYNYPALTDVYNILGSSALIINKKDKLKSLQKNMFKKVVSTLCQNIPKMTFNEYYDVMNNSDTVIRYVVIKNGELRYA